MLIHLHSQATTTPQIRAAIQASDVPASVLAERFGTTEQTVYKWKHRDTVHDRSHRPHRLRRNASLHPARFSLIESEPLEVSRRAMSRARRREAWRCWWGHYPCGCARGFQDHHLSEMRRQVASAARFRFPNGRGP